MSLINFNGSPNSTCIGLVKIGLLNSLVFLIFSILGDFYNFQSMTYLVLILGTFSAVSLCIFIFAVDRGLILAPIFWFILGTGIFYGLGTIPHIFNIFDQSSKSWYGGYTYSDVIKACWINGLSCLTVTFFSLPLICSIKKNISPDISKNIPIKLFNLMLLISLCMLMLRVILFPLPENFLIRGFLDKCLYLVLSTLLLGGMLFFRITLFQRLWIIFLIASMLILGVMGASKYDAMIPLVSFFAGFIFSNLGRYRLAISLLVISTAFVFSSSMINTIRGNCNYDSVGNSLVDRVIILKDSIQTLVYKDSFCKTIEINTNINPNFRLESYVYENGNFNVTKSGNQFSKIMRRISTTSIATFLINEYDSGRIGHTLGNVYAFFIPRIVWPEKPIMTGAGQDLGALYYPGNPPNSLGPTFSAELYWNYGLFGVILGSALIGVVIGLLSRWSIFFINGDFYGYTLIAIPAMIYAFWVESWVGSTYVGGFVSILQILLAYFLVIFIVKYIVMKFYSFTFVAISRLLHGLKFDK